MWLLLLILSNLPVLSADKPAGRLAPDIKVLKSDRNGVEFLYSPPKLTLKPYPDIPNTSTQPEIGNPILPVRYVPIGVPVGSKVEIKVLGFETKEFTDIDIPPLSLLTEQSEKDKRIYSQNAFWPEEVVSIDEQKVYRSQEVVRLRINPVRYNPQQQSIVFYSNLRIRVNFHGGRGVPRHDRIFDGVFQKVLLNYEEAKNWRVEKKLRPKKSHPGPWYKIELQDEGIYKISKTTLQQAGIPVDEIDPQTIKLYNGGSKMKTEIADSLLIEIPIYVSEDTSVIFYGTSLSGWNKNEPDKLFLNPYTNTNVYWLTNGGMTGRRDSVSGEPESAPIPEYFIDTVHVEKDYLCPAKCGLGWVREKLEREASESSISRYYSFSVQGLQEDSCEMIVSVVRFYQLYISNADYNRQIHRIRLYINGRQFYDWVSESGNGYPDIIKFTAAGLVNGTNTLTLELYRDASDTERDVIWFDYFEIVYKKRYEAYNGNLKFRGEGTNLEFRLEGFEELPVIFDITDCLEPKRVYGAIFEDGIVKFQGSGEVYYASDNFKTPAINKESPYNLWDRNTDIDFIIITHPDFLDYAERLKDYREAQGRNTAVLSIFDVYNNFSWGLRNSPYAIKNLLNFAYDNWGIPGYCLLFGAGTHAYRELGLEKNRIPPYEGGYRVVEFGYPSSDMRCDDHWFTENNFAIGRITVRTKDEARNTVEKITKYEKNSGVWQNRILLFADDEVPLGGGFIPWAEGLEDRIPSNFDVFKVYLPNYKKVGSFKPGATTDIIRYFDKGMFMSFAGAHGNLKLLTEERVFKNPEHIYALNNKSKLPFSQFWSCGVGCFDRRYDESMADFMQKIKDKGSIGTIASTRATSTAGGLPNRLIDYFLIEEGFETMGQGVYGIELDGSIGKNKTLFADPTTKLPRRTIEVTIDSLPDTLKSGTMMTVSGEAKGAEFAYITIRSPECNYVYNWKSKGTITYKMRGQMIDDRVSRDILFEGLTKVENGKWSQQFIFPANIDSLVCGDNGKISVFAWRDDSCGSTAIDTIVIAEGPENTTDKTGPTIELFANGKLLQDDDLVPTEFTLMGVLEDTSGINVFDRTYPLDLALSVTINGGQEISLADYFQYDLGSCTRGSFSYPITLERFDEVATLEVTASDNVGNPNTKSVTVNVASTDKITIRNLRNYPNPVRSEHTHFSFFMPRTAQVELKIYTIAGRLIRTIRAYNQGPGQVRIYWDTRDELGNRVGNGIYIYKVKASIEEAITKAETSEISKLMILR